MTNNRRDQLSVLARGRGLVSGGVELECIPDYRHSCSLSGDVFLASSPSDKCCKVNQSYVLALPKTYVTRRGQMVLFTAPEDMVIGRGLQCHSSMEVSKVAVKELKTTSGLCETTKKYQDTCSEATDIKPGQFTSVYLEKLRSVQPMVDEEVADPSTDVPMVSVSDSGIESSTSHPTTISGRTSSLSNRTDSSYNIVIPAADTTIKHGETTNDNTESTTMGQFTNDDKVSKGDVVTNSSELTDIIFSIPANNRNNSYKNKINSNKKTTKKALKKKLTPKNESKSGINHEQKKAIPIKSHCIPGKRKVKKKSKTTKLSESSLSSSTSLSETVNSRTELHHTIVGDGIGTTGTSGTTDPTGTDPTGTVIASAGSTGTDPTCNDPTTSQVRKEDKRKALMAARANERRLTIEKKRQELEEMKLSKQLEEEKNKALKEQLNKERKQESEPTCMSEQEGIQDNADENDRQQKPEEESQQCEVLPSSTMNILTLREALRHSRDSQQKTRMILMDHKQNEPTTSSSTTTGDTEVRATTTDKDRRLLPKPVVKAVVENKELDYKTHLEQLLGDRHSEISRPTSHYFSYFSYLPKKKTNTGAKENRRTAKRKK